MTRIVGGSARGRHLVVPPKGTRPTSDRAREALFNTLAGLVDLEGARVLDLYAGTGAVGLEALSRGARHVTFVENDRATVAVLQRNVALVGLAEAVVMRASAAPYLVTAGADLPFRFVFADPPYAVRDSVVAALLDRLGDGRWLEDEGVVVIERSARSPAPQWPTLIEPIKQRRYGEGVLWYGRRR